MKGRYLPIFVLASSLSVLGSGTAFAQLLEKVDYPVNASPVQNLLAPQAVNYYQKTSNSLEANVEPAVNQQLHPIISQYHGKGGFTDWSSAGKEMGFRILQTGGPCLLC